jgi:hypothetical protein
MAGQMCRHKGICHVERATVNERMPGGSHSRRAAYGGRPVVASSILVTPRLAFADQLIEIRAIAKV